MSAVPVARSNSLADLAARIRAEHEASSAALNKSVEHAIRAGELLIEAKEKVPHGQWLPWLTKNCSISERSAQLYMRFAKNREAIEERIRNGVADLTLNQAAALLVMSSDVKQLFAFVRDCEGLSGDELVERCIAEGVTVIQTPNYDPLAGRTEAEKLEWYLFNMFLSFDRAAGRAGGEPKAVSEHVEWVLQGPFQNVAEWLGEEGDRFRSRCGMRPVSEQFLAEWTAFLAAHRERTLAEVGAQLEALQRAFEQEAPIKPLSSRPPRQSRRRASLQAGGP